MDDALIAFLTRAILSGRLTSEGLARRPAELVALVRRRGHLPEALREDTMIRFFYDPTHPPTATKLAGIVIGASLHRALAALVSTRWSDELANARRLASDLALFVRAVVVLERDLRGARKGDRVTPR